MAMGSADNRLRSACCSTDAIVLGQWDVSNVTSFDGGFNTGFLEGVELSAANYDALLIG